MYSRNDVVKIPDVLGLDGEQLNSFYQLAQEIPLCDSYTLDMDDVSFVKPYGFLSLVLISRILASKSGRPVSLINLRSSIHHYFRRMNIVNTAGTWLRISGKTNEEWDRNPATQNLLELTLIQNKNDVISVVTRTESIFARWLQINNLRELMTAVSELCTNIYEHSQDKYGCILIQKYAHQIAGYVTVELAVGDLGIGIKGSLSVAGSKKQEAPIYYLRQAMEGKTSRNTGRGGLGLRTVEGIAAQNQGVFWIRSDSASIQKIGNSRRLETTSLADFQGTQVLVKFKAPIAS